MYTKFSIKNFRVFGQEGAEMMLRPVTILTGCNNSGKSSVTKALCLLKDFCRQIEEDYSEGRPLHLERYKMDFWKAPNSILGSFDNVLHHGPIKEKGNDESKGSGKRIVFELVVESFWLLQNIILHLEFGSVDGDDLNNGYLKSYSIKTLDEKIIYQDSIDDGKAQMDFSSVKKSLLFFLYGQYAYSRADNYLHYPEELQEENMDEIDASIEELDNLNYSIVEKCGTGAFKKMMEGYFLQKQKKMRKKAMDKVPDPSFVLNSPQLGVYCYFPCLKEFSEIEKKNVRKKINEYIAAQNSPISSFEQKMIELFVDSFEASDVNTLHEYIGQEEDKVFFVHDNIFDLVRFNRNKQFAFPCMSGVSMINSIYSNDSDLPNKADWQVIIRSMDLINKAVTQTTKQYANYSPGNGCIVYETNFDVDKYVRATIEEIFANIMPGEFIYSPTTIVQPRRLYSIEDTNDFSNTLNRYFEMKMLYSDPNLDKSYRYQKDKRYKICSFVNKWLIKFDVAKRVEIKAVAENSGAIIRLYGNNDRKGMLLADKGLGISQLFAVLLKIENAIIELKINEKIQKYDNWVFNDSFVKNARLYNEINPVTIALEEPEVHLHPRYQSLLADMIVEAYQKYNVHFIIETHSEYFIRKLQVLVASSKSKCTPDDISLNYIERDDCGTTTNRGIKILDDGRLGEPFGSGFFDEATGLSMDLLNMKIESK